MFDVEHKKKIINYYKRIVKGKSFYTVCINLKKIKYKYIEYMERNLLRVEQKCYVRDL